MLKEAMVEMLNQGEFEKMYKYAFSVKEKEEILSDWQLARVIKGAGVENISEILVLGGIKSVETFRDAFCFMK